MRKIFIYSTLLMMVATIGCKDPYEPTIISSPAAYLVIEGVLNAGQGPTALKLSRTYKLDDTARLRPELDAQVLVEGKDNTVRQLPMTGPGIYTTPDLGLIVNQEYRLVITTTNGKQYISEYVLARPTPAIDSIGFVQNEDGVQVYVNTHDPANNTWYYLWDFEETWEIRAFYYSRYIYENQVVRPRSFGEDVSTCWKYGISHNILIGTSAALRSDIIEEAPLQFISNGEEKLAVRYSILVHQYALDKPGYTFYEMMKKNTESLGTIFDAQPSQVSGNITCASDPNELVIGYISASVVQEKRFFIAHRDLPDGWRFDQFCPADTIPNHPDSIKLAYGMGNSIYDGIRSPFSPDIVAYEVARAPCVDCKERQGSVVRPSYW